MELAISGVAVNQSDTINSFHYWLIRAKLALRHFSYDTIISGASNGTERLLRVANIQMADIAQETLTESSERETMPESSSLDGGNTENGDFVREQFIITRIRRKTGRILTAVIRPLPVRGYKTRYYCAYTTCMSLLLNVSLGLLCVYY